MVVALVVVARLDRLALVVVTGRLPVLALVVMALVVMALVVMARLARPAVMVRLAHVVVTVPVLAHSLVDARALVVATALVLVPAALIVAERAVVAALAVVAQPLVVAMALVIAPAAIIVAPAHILLLVGLLGLVRRLLVRLLVIGLWLLVRRRLLLLADLILPLLLLIAVAWPPGRAVSVVLAVVAVRQTVAALVLVAMPERSVMLVRMVARHRRGDGDARSTQGEHTGDARGGDESARSHGPSLGRG